MRVGCTLQNCVKAGVFAPRQQSRSEGALRAASPAPIPPSLIGNGRDAIFMNRDVVEIAQQSCTLSSRERNSSRRFDAFLPGKRPAKNSDAYRTFLA